MEGTKFEDMVGISELNCGLRTKVEVINRVLSHRSTNDCVFESVQ